MGFPSLCPYSDQTNLGYASPTHQEIGYNFLHFSCIIWGLPGILFGGTLAFAQTTNTGTNSSPSLTVALNINTHGDTDNYTDYLISH